jgi:hypothetical protein
MGVQIDDLWLCNRHIGDFQLVEVMVFELKLGEEKRLR